jgi:hypothetical protein
MEGIAAMSARNFGSLFMVASCAGAALGCYLVSLRVASERAQLEDVETKIVVAERDMRVIQTEIGTRGRLSQLERWNAGAFALSAPAADQFVKGGFELARLVQPQQKVDFKAPVVLASAPAPEAKAPIGEAATDDGGATASEEPRSLLHEASYKTGTREVPSEPAATAPLNAAGSHVHTAATAKASVAAKDAPKKAVDKPAAATRRPAKAVDNHALAVAKAVTKPVRLAKADPLAPLPDKHSARTSAKASKDLHPAR